MSTEIDRNEVRQLLEEGAQLLEVLAPEEFDAEHLAGAVNIPLQELDRQTSERLDRGRPIVVYCYDSQWDLSPRAAARLESLGFENVFDYVAGKADWAAAGLPIEVEASAPPRIGALARRDLPSCRLEDRPPAALDRMRESGWPFCVVVNAERVVLGLLHEEDFASSANRSVEEVMDLAPATFRPDVPAQEMREYMDKHDLDTALVTTSDGRLLGGLLRRDLEATDRDSSRQPAAKRITRQS